MQYASVVFDFDSTVIDAETLDVLSETVLEGRNDKAQVVDEIRRITAMGMNGEIPFSESLARRMALMAPKREHIDALAARMPAHLTRSFRDHLDFFQREAGNVYIVSNGFVELIYPVSDILNIPRENVFASRFAFDADGTASVVREGVLLEAHGKAKAAAASGAKRPLLVVGDGWTDYEIKREGAADAFIAYVEHARREKVVAVADATVASFDELIPLLEHTGLRA